VIRRPVEVSIDEPPFEKTLRRIEKLPFYILKIENYRIITSIDHRRIA